MPAANPYALELSNLAAAIAGEAEPLLGRDDAVAQARVIEALYRSAESGEAVRPDADGAGGAAGRHRLRQPDARVERRRRPPPRRCWRTGSSAPDWRSVEEVAPGRPNVIGVARGSGGGRTLLLNGHLDTVGLLEPDGGLAARVDGGRLYGRGAYDMKGSLAAIASAGAECARRGLRGT